MKDHKKKAQDCLEYLRSRTGYTGYYESFLEDLHRNVRNGGLTLKDIGTSKKELKKLQVKGCKISAQNSLEHLRSGTGYYERFLEDLHRNVRNGGLTPKDIGTSEEELKKLRVKGYKISAQNWLDRLRSGTDQYDQYESFLEYLHSYLEMAGLTPKDIGTSKKELKKLLPVTVEK